MDLIVYFNGNFVKAVEAKVSIYDHGFLYGDGVFETMRSYRKHVFKFEDHMHRLFGSMKQLNIEPPAAPSIMLKAIKLLLQYNQLQDAYIRIAVTRGEGPIGLDISLCPSASFLIITEPLHVYSVSWYLHGISTVIVSRRKVPDVCVPASIKSSNYLVNILARKEAKDKGAQEGIMLNMEGYIGEGTTSNIFLVKEKKLITPALSSGILNGITRRNVIELAEKRHIEVVEKHLSPDEIFSSEECFLTSTTMEIMPVSFCEGTQIADGKPGKITRILMKDYKKLVEDEIAKER